MLQTAAVSEHHTVLWVFFHRVYSDCDLLSMCTEQLGFDYFLLVKLIFLIFCDNTVLIFSLSVLVPKCYSFHFEMLQ